MSEHITEIKDLPPPSDDVAFSNGIRLGSRQWVGVGFFAVAFVLAAPSLWNQVEDFPVERDYRIPRELGNDYWLYERHAQQAAQHNDGVVIGDSVVWGEYVRRDETLSHFLNKNAGGEHFANRACPLEGPPRESCAGYDFGDPSDAFVHHARREASYRGGV